MKTIQLGGTFYNFDLIYSIDPHHQQLEELVDKKFVFVEKFRPQALIWQVNKDRAAIETFDEVFLTRKEALTRAQELIKQALTNSNL